MKTFLKPLTTQEETFYLRKCRQGDKAARDVLIERNLRLVAHIVKKYQGVDEDLDDLISIGTIGLIKAVSTYDMTKGREVSLNEPIGTDKEGNEIHLLDIVEANEQDITDQCIHKERILQLYGCLREVLSPLEYEVIKYRYGLFGEKELTQRALGKRLGISRSYVSRIEKNALKKLRTLFH